jgi:glycosyltransferase involved in cell wall biosynthesis
MKNNKVSVIVPIFNEGCEGVRETIYSVLKQSYQYFEIIVTGNFSNQFAASFENSVKPRLKFIHCEEESGALARVNGVNAASGDLILFLLPGDVFHPEKIHKHLCFRENHPEAIMTYNPHFIVGKGGNVWLQSDAIANTVYADAIINSPITLSDIVINRDWFLKRGIFNIKYGSRGGDLDFLYRFVIRGDKVFKLDQCLNSNLFIRELFSCERDSEFDGVILALEDFYSNEYCPKEIKVKRNTMMGRIYANRANLSFFRGETSDGQQWIRGAILLDRTILDNQAERFLRLLINNCLIYAEDFEAIFRKVIAQLPPELEWIVKNLDESIARGYLLSGISDIFWGRIGQAEKNFSRASHHKLNIDLRFLNDILKQISDYQVEFGVTATNNVVNNIGRNLAKIGQLKNARWIVGTYNINQAFFDYRNRRYDNVPSLVVRAITKQPGLIFNQGALSIFFQSLFKNFNSLETFVENQQSR